MRPPPFPSQPATHRSSAPLRAAANGPGSGASSKRRRPSRQLGTGRRLARSFQAGWRARDALAFSPAAASLLESGERRQARSQATRGSEGGEKGAIAGLTQHRRLSFARVPPARLAARTSPGPFSARSSRTSPERCQKKAGRAGRTKAGRRAGSVALPSTMGRVVRGGCHGNASPRMGWAGERRGGGVGATACPAAKKDGRPCWVSSPRSSGSSPAGCRALAPVGE